MACEEGKKVRFEDLREGDEILFHDLEHFQNNWKTWSSAYSLDVIREGRETSVSMLFGDMLNKVCGKKMILETVYSSDYVYESFKVCGNNFYYAPEMVKCITKRCNRVL